MLKPKLLLLGIDGLCPRVINHCGGKASLPTLSRLTEGGLSAPLRSTLPPNSGSAWTSICTGVNPGKHGVTGFSRWELQNGVHRFAGLFTSRDVPVEYFWETLDRSAGVRSLVLRVPCTFPARPFEGAIVAEEDFSIATAEPPSLQPILDDPAHKVQEHWLGEGWEDHAGDVILKTARLTRALYEEVRPDVCFVVFYVLDFVNHRVGFASDRFLELARRTDEAVASLLTMDEFTDIAVVSDHGMRVFDCQFLLEAWLLRQGYMEWDEKHSCPDWRGTKLYCTPSDIPGNYGKLFLNRGLVPEKRRLTLLAELRQRLLEPQADGFPIALKVWSRDEVYHGPFADTMPDLVFRGHPRARVVSIWNNEAALSPEVVTRRAFLNAGCHAREGVFAWHGPGFAPIRLREGLDAIDVGAFVLSRFGVPLPSNYDGRVPESVYLSTPLFARLGEQPAVPPPWHAQIEPEEQDRIIESLQSLGYM